MKKNAINQFLLFVTLFFCLIFSSCINSLIDDSEDNSLPPLTFDGSDYVTISGCISPEINNGRSAFPTVPDLMSGASFSYKIIVKSGEDTLVTKDDNSLTSWDGLTYEVNVPKGENLQIVIEIYNTSYPTSQKIFSGTSEPFNVDENTTTKNVDVTVMPLPQDEGQTGNIHLYFKNTSTKNLFVKNSLDETISFPLYANAGTGFFHISVSTGSHTVKFDFYENDASGQLLFSCTQVINVYSGLTTNEWVKNGDESYIQEEGENAIVITDELIKSYMQTVVYVDREYTDEDANGSYFKPYNELSDAINKIISLSDDNITYKVYLKSDISVRGALNELRNHKIEIASVGNEKKEMEDCIGIASVNGYNDGNITFKNLKFSGNDEFRIESLKSVAFEDCIVAPKVDFRSLVTTEFHLKGKCSFTGGIDFTDIVAKITLDSVVKPAESGFVAKVIVNDYFSGDLSSLFDNSGSSDEKVLKSLAYFCIKKENGTENIFIKTESTMGSTMELVPLTTIKFVADGNANTNGLGVAGDDSHNNGSMGQPYATVKKAIESFSMSSETNRYIFIAGNIQETSTVEFTGSSKTWYIRGWNGVELDPSNPEIDKIDTITRDTNNDGSMFSIGNVSSSSIEVNLYNLKIDGNGVTAGIGGSGSKVGAGIYINENNKLNLDNVWFTKCKTDYAGGAIYANTNSEITAKNCCFGRLTEEATGTDDLTCSTTYFGGAIHSGGRINLENTKFIGCSSTTVNGAAIFIDVTGLNPIIENCTFSNNTAKFATIYSKVALEITDSTFNNCIGGAIFNTGSTSGTTIINNCIFKDNTVTNGDGGAIYSAVALEITDSTFDNCSANNGGAIYQLDKELTIKCDTKSVEFNGCRSNTNGGAIYLGLSNDSNSSINCRIVGKSNYNCIISGCSGTRGGGIGIDNKANFSSDYLKITSCTASSYGGGFWTKAYTAMSVSFTNSIISYCGCSSSDNGGGIFLGNSANLTLDNSNILNCTVANNSNGSGIAIKDGSKTVVMSGSSTVYSSSQKNDIYADGTQSIKIAKGFSPSNASATSPMRIGYKGGSEFRLFEKETETDFDDEAFKKCLAPFKLDADTEKKFYLVKDNANYNETSGLGYLVTTIYVSGSGTASGNGTSSNPYKTIKAAVNSIGNVTSKVIYVSGDITENSVTAANQSISFPANKTVRVVGIGDTHKVTTGEVENEYCIFKIPSTSTVIFENMDFDGIKFNYTGSDTSVEAESSVFKVESSGNLTLNSCKFTEIKNNVLTSSSIQPYSSCINNFGNVSIINSIFGKTDVTTYAVGNSYSCGGSKVKGAFIYNSGTMDIKKCTFSYGYSGNSAGAGAIYNNGGNLTFAPVASTKPSDKTVFQYCYGNAAGAIYNNNGIVTGANTDNCEMKECYKQKNASYSEEETVLVHQTEG